VLAADLFGKTLGQVASDGDTLTFCGFQGKTFGALRTVPRPPVHQFRAPPGMGRRLQAFYLNGAVATDGDERVFVLDIARQLVCWTAVPGAAPAFAPVASAVVGAQQRAGILAYACVGAGTTTFYHVPAKVKKPQESLRFKWAAERVLFAEMSDKTRPDDWLLALQSSRTEWVLVHGCNRVTVTVAEGDKVLALARMSERHGREPALLVLKRGQKTVELHSAKQRHVVLRTELAIAQLVLDGAGEQLCWMVSRTHELCVRKLHGDKPLLRVVSGDVVSEGEPDAE
jgi:hypothetical protein